MHVGTGRGELGSLGLWRVGTAGPQGQERQPVTLRSAIRVLCDGTGSPGNPCQSVAPGPVQSRWRALPRTTFACGFDLCLTS